MHHSMRRLQGDSVLSHDSPKGTTDDDARIIRRQTMPAARALAGKLANALRDRLLACERELERAFEDAERRLEKPGREK